MPETLGLLLLTAAGAGEAGTGIAGLGTLASTTVFGASLATIVGSTAIIGVSIGLQYALNNPDVPKPENGAQPLKQAIPPRVRGYWINRLAGNYMLFLAAGGDSQDMLAFHSGPIEEVLQIYLHDIAVSTVPDPSHGATLTVQQTGSGYFLTGAIQIQIFFGVPGQSTYGGILNSTSTSGTWLSTFVGNGVACLAMTCTHASTPTQFTQVYPQGLPLPSVVAKCSPIWDPRDPGQSLGDETTWLASPNPVLQLIDYLTRADGGMGEDMNIILPPDALSQWMTEASLCDFNVGGRPRYNSAGWYQFDNSPENVVNKILATCDGWLGESGDGTLVLTVGVYRDPTDPPILAQHILGYSINFGIADESIINQLDVSYTNPNLAYVSDQIDAVRDEASISLTGIVRSKPLDLSWVQDPGQAALLGGRAMLRLNPKRSGTLVTTLYGMRYLGKRWVKIQFPGGGSDLADCVVEIQDRAQVDILAGRVTFNWNLVDPAAFNSLQ